MSNTVSNFEVLGEKLEIKDAFARNELIKTNENISETAESLRLDMGKKETRLTELVFIGDSFTTGYQSDGSSIAENLRIPQLFAKFTGLNLHNYGVNASGYTISGNTFYSQALRAISDSSFDHSKVKYCVILGGINDVNNNPNSNIAEASASIRAVLYENFVNCKVLQFPNWGGVSFNTFDSWKVFNQIGYTNDLYPVYYYPKNALALVGYPEYVNNDNIHPNVNGARIIAKTMTALINGANYSHGGINFIHPEAHTGWDCSNLTIYMTEESINCFGFIKATKTITGEDLDVCDIPKPFTFPVGCSFLGLRSDVINTREQSIQVYVNPPLTLTSQYTVGNITLGVDALQTIEAGAQIAITFSIPRLPFGV